MAGEKREVKHVEPTKLVFWLGENSEYAFLRFDTEDGERMCLDLRPGWAHELYLSIRRAYGDV